MLDETIVHAFRIEGGQVVRFDIRSASQLSTIKHWMSADRTSAGSGFTHRGRPVFATSWCGPLERLVRIIHRRDAEFAEGTDVIGAYEKHHRLSAQVGQLTYRLLSLSPRPRRLRGESSNFAG